MRLREKGSKKDDPGIHMDFGQAQAALQSGAYEVVEEEGEPGPEVHHGVFGDDPSVTDAPDAKKPEPAPKAKSDK